MNEKQPLKYQELMRPDYPAPAGSPRRVQEAYTRLFEGNETLADRDAIERNAYYSHWGIDDFDEPEPESSEDEKFRRIVTSEMDPKRYFKRQAKLYKGFIRRVFHLQAKIDTSPTGETIVLKYDAEGNAQRTTINQSVVDNLINMAGRMRESLYDAGYQSIVNKIHGDLGITVTQDGKLAKEVIISQEGGDIYGS